ncbi:MAG TPA: alpha/beta hydrolase [Solirubrobacterales bacterium]
MRRRTALAGFAGAAGLAAAGALAQKRLADSIAADPESERLRRPLRGEERSVQGADGNRLHVEAFGPVDAPKLVLVHGWMCAIPFWRWQIEELAADFRVIAYDQRGHGRSAGAADYSFDAFADDLGCVLAAVAADDERVLAAGHSMGAMTIAAWAGRRPAEVGRRLAGCLLSSTGLGDLIMQSVVMRTPERLTGLRDPLGRLLMGAELPVPATPTPLGDAAVRFVAMNPEASPARVAFVRRMVLSANPKARGAAGRSMARMDLWQALESLTVPTTVITGAADKMTPPALAHRLADTLPSLVELVELPGIGHMAPIEAPEKVNEAIRGLSEPSSAAAPRRTTAAIAE